jgi:putative hydrolase of the HAD superfamily
MLSMIETAIEVTERRVPASVIAEILTAGQEMLAHPIELLPEAEDTVRRLAESHTLVLITKGDLLDQERKLAQSGLGSCSTRWRSCRTSARRLFPRFRAHGDGPDSAMMIGNSMKSDVLPAIEAGAWGVFVPHGLTWELEHAAGTRGPSAVS